VGVHYNRSAEPAEAVVAEVTGGGGRAMALQADLMSDAACDALVAHAAERLGPLGCLVNNASVFENDRIDTITRQSWDRHMQVNLRAPLVLSQAFARQLPDDDHGVIINMLDQRVWNMTPFFMSYTVSKVGLWTLTRTLAMALAPRIRVNGIGPGPTLPSERQSEAHFVRQWSGTPLGRPVSLDDICRAVRFILDSPSLTGQMMAFDGGQHLGWSPRAAEQAVHE
jgi:NAD(P)-dependent dehydrogenase (short-subunit alcohol dehydrogenase family)